MNLRLDGQIVLVTGSSHGIGHGIAEAFLQEGAIVILSGREVSQLRKAKESLGRDYDAQRIFIFAGDLQQVSMIALLAEYLEGKFGKLDLLVCNIGSGRSIPPLEEDDDEWKRMLDINLLSATRCVRLLLPLLKRSIAQKVDTASIVFISSICGMESLGCPVAYSAAKSALIAYAKNIARPLGKMRIRVNVVSPGNIGFSGSTWEEKIVRSPQEVEKMLKEDVPMGRLGTVEEVANAVMFLSSPCASFITGVNIAVDGGQCRFI